jgi:acetyl esterase/lipase
VTIVPDATSFGAEPYGAYLVGKVAGRAALDAARAAFHTTQALGVPIARKAVIAGLSQGAHSTMAAAAQLLQYSPHLEIRGFAAAEPPSHLAPSLQQAVQADRVNIVFDALRLWSWQSFFHLSGGGVFRPPYDTQAPQAFQSDCLYDGASGKPGTLAMQFPNDASTVLSDEFLGYAKNDAWPADWTAQNAASEQVPAGVKQPVVIYEGTADVTVLPANTQAYVDELKASGVAVDYRLEQGGTHGTTALSSFTVTQVAEADAEAWMKQQLAN